MHSQQDICPQQQQIMQDQEATPDLYIKNSSTENLSQKHTDQEKFNFQKQLWQLYFSKWKCINEKFQKL